VQPGAGRVGGRRRGRETEGGDDVADRKDLAPEERNEPRGGQRSDEEADRGRRIGQGSGVFFRLACLTSLPILIAGMIVYRKGGFYFPNGGIELPILWALVQISLVLIGPGPLSVNSPVRARKGLLGWLLL
jgi:hypothetical protein